MTEIYLTKTDYLDNDAEFERILNSLPKWKREAVLRIKIRKKQLLGAAAFVLSQKVLENHGIKGEIRKTDSGKPYIEGSDMFLSISHSENLAAVALSDYEIGIDAEKNRPKIPKAVKIFSDDVRGRIKTSADFMKYWTMYEAHIKCGGTEFLQDGLFYHTFIHDGYTISLCSPKEIQAKVHHTLI